MSKFCGNCGGQMEDFEKFCPMCGAPQENSNMNNDFNSSFNSTNMNNRPSETNVLAVIGFVLAILGIFCFGILFEPAAIVLGIIAKKQIKSNPNQSGSVLATSAIVIGIIGVLILIAAFAVKILGALI